MQTRLNIIVKDHLCYSKSDENSERGLYYVVVGTRL